PATGSTLTIADGQTLTVSTGGTLSGNNTGDQIATGVAYTPTGAIAAVNVQTAINELDTEKAPLASPTFTGVVTMPSPFTLGATSVTSTGAQLNFLNAATGTTGTTSTNLVYSTSPTLVTPTLGAAAATSINSVALTNPGGPATLTLANGSTLATSG
ncbi:hypothetical protein JZU71_00120, partial [bacterium]|nr:hypothetical protein [bacterium]